MATGTVKWFNVTKGYGFITPDANGPDAFVHINDLNSAGLRSLSENQRVSYELMPSRNGKDSAKNISLI